MIASRVLPLLLLVALSAPLNGQEVRYIDLTTVQQRTELRCPPAPTVKFETDAPCLRGGSGGSSVPDAAPDPRDPRALGIYVLRVTPTDIDPTQPFEAEFQVLNTGRLSIDLPVSPHLSDLQPGDASLAFSYFSLAPVTMAPVEPYAEVRSFGLVQLYGSPVHDGTMIVLQPGEWIRVKANIKLARWPTQPAAGRVRGALWLHKNTFHPLPGRGYIETQDLSPYISLGSPTTWVPVHLHRPAAPGEGKQ
jgi:hypothetical protein